ncbi:hypothetical protein C1H46_040593 [Malus baccata]|uniref:Uncharacterized protein n=1 Tax=Malus baccata TaxID=106549 RepID=A0A540KI41_MALBA|nr:hypothetical protein C1H46_040593 [Malus baccata]
MKGPSAPRPEFKPGSVCLAKMVQNFIEESNEKQPPPKCGRNRCNCFHGNSNDSSDDELDIFSGGFGDSISCGSFGGDASDILKSDSMRERLGEKPPGRYGEDRRSKQESQTKRRFEEDVSWMHMKPNNLHPKSFSGVRLHMPVVKRSASVVVKASSDIDGTAAANEGSEPLPDSKEEAVVPVDKLPLESRLQEWLEQKKKMQLAKKIRLRRNRLVRKRKLRKKGRWPPSKMKKLKNV